MWRVHSRPLIDGQQTFHKPAHEPILINMLIVYGGVWYIIFKYSIDLQTGSWQYINGL